jgi:hypothetical protein
MANIESLGYRGRATIVVEIGLKDRHGAAGGCSAVSNHS